MRIWHRFVLLVFPGSLEEYYEARKIHFSEIREYRKRFQYVLGAFLFFLPLIYLLITLDNWLTRGLILLMIFGEACIRDTVSEHYCLVLHRIRHNRPADSIASIAECPR